MKYPLLNKRLEYFQTTSRTKHRNFDVASINNQHMTLWINKNAAKSDQNKELNAAKNLELNLIQTNQLTLAHLSEVHQNASHNFKF